jgi:hypothetical protein
MGEAGTEELDCRPMVPGRLTLPPVLASDCAAEPMERFGELPTAPDCESRSFSRSVVQDCTLADRRSSVTIQSIECRKSKSEPYVQNSVTCAHDEIKTTDDQNCYTNNCEDRRE